jgi:hypothetical protein
VQQYKKRSGKELDVAYSTIIQWVSPVVNIKKTKQGLKWAAPEYKLYMSFPEANCSVGKNTF